MIWSLHLVPVMRFVGMIHCASRPGLASERHLVCNENKEGSSDLIGVSLESFVFPWLNQL